MALVPSTPEYSRLSVILAVAGMCFFFASPALSQAYQGGEGERARGQSSPAPAHSFNLPDWAKPAEPSPNYSEQSQGADLDGSMRTKAPPPGGEPVPVDGGLALLAAAGAGYAVRKLGKDDDDSDEEEPV